MASEDFGKTPVAIVGMGCRMPGAENLDEYWKMIIEGRSAIGPVPDHRLDRSLYFDTERGKTGYTYTDLGGIVHERPLDRDLCPVSDALIARSDVAHLNICEVASSALVNAGIDPRDVPTKRTGVYVGHSGGSDQLGDITFRDYFGLAAKLVQQSGALEGLSPAAQADIITKMTREVRELYADNFGDGPKKTGSSTAATLISEVHGFSGPTVAIDAACASSLMAMALATQALQRGQIDMAIAGGASYSKWMAFVLFSMARSISATGTCPFDANADGLISSDGYGIVVLKTLPKAVADGDDILGVIRSIGISSDGRGKSLWAPMAKGQIKAIQRAYSGDVTPDSLQYIECHATSTQVGDATELSSLAAGFEGRIAPGRKLPIGSVKANVGHTLEAAGIAGVMKATLAMRYGKIPKQINFETPNPEIDWNNIPFEVVRETSDWMKPANGAPRRCAVNSFGIGGLNVHIVLDDDLSAEERSKFAGGQQTSSAARALVEPAKKEFDPIAIVGSSVIAPGALTQAALWELLKSGRDPKQELPADRCWSADLFQGPDSPLNVPTTRGGYIDDFVYDWKRHKIPPKQIADANPLQFMLLDAADQAFNDAGYDERDFDREMTSVVVGSIFGGDFSISLTMGIHIQVLQKLLANELRQKGMSEEEIEQAKELVSKRVLKSMPALLDETGSFTCSTLASRLSKSFDLMGGALAMDADEVSSLSALNVGIGMLQTGHSNVVLCAAGQQSMDGLVFDGLDELGVLSGGDAKSPADQNFDGVLPAEGVAVLVLKRLSDAQKDGDRVRGIIRGTGDAFVADGSAKATFDSFEIACEAASLSAADIGMVESTGLQSSAVAETELLETLLAKRPDMPVVSSTVNTQLGYIKGASGMLSIVKSLLEFEHNELPKEFGFETAVNETEAEATRVVAEPLTATTANGKAISAVTHFSVEGFGQTVLLESPTTVPKPSKAARQPSVAVAQPAGRSKIETCFLAAASRIDLGNQLSRLRAASASELLAASHKKFASTELVRVAFPVDTANNTSSIESAWAAFSSHLSPEKAAREGVYLADMNFSSTGQTAALSPGQGSQYATMCDALTAASPAAMRRLAEANSALTAQRCGTFDVLRTKSDVLSVQLAMLVADVVHQAAAEEIGFVPDVVCGHSYGEYAALIHAGAWSFENAVAATKHRAEVVDLFGGKGGALTSVSSDRATVEELVTNARETIYVANINGPRQIVVGGEQTNLDRFEATLKSNKIAFQRLNVPAAYHTPLMQPAVNDFRDRLSQIPIEAPKKTFISSIGNRVVIDPAEIRENLAVQLMSPMDFVGLVVALRKHGVTTCVELGPKQVLSKLVGQIAPAAKLMSLPLDRRDFDWETITRQVRSALSVRGHFDDLGELEQPAPPQVPSKISVTPRDPSSAPRTPQGKQPMKSRHEIVHFDATAPRKEANRQKALEKKRLAAGEESAPTNRIASSPAPAAVAAPATPAPAAKQAPVPVATAAPDPAAPAPATPSRGPLPSRAELEAFAIEYIVDQTGYPEDMVELDVDLEADLGIDSIKKAQMLGEMAQKFELSWLADEVTDLSLDQFPTLDSIVGFLSEDRGGSAAPASTAPAAVAAPTPAPVATAAPAPAAAASRGPLPSRAELESFAIEYIVDQTGYPEDMVELDVDLEADLGIDSIKKAQMLGEMAQKFGLNWLADEVTDLSLDQFPTLDSIVGFLSEDRGGSAAAQAPAAAQAAPVAVATPAPAPVATATPAPTAPAASSRGPLPNRAELESFAIEYIVDQTGYPEDMVELDVDLEADLGIDSIKKAQMLGEMAQKFELNWLADEVTDLSLDQFPTLDSIVGFLSEDRGGSAATAATAPVAAPNPAPAATAAPAPAAPAPAPAAPSRGPLPNRAELESFAIEYIVDQTGYPEDMVELDVDLEADLGIDSIKKAQMLGEMAQKFELNWLADEVTDLSLDQFPTLDSIVGFLSEDRAGSAAAPAPVAVEAAAPEPPSRPRQSPTASAPVTNVAATSNSVQELHGHVTVLRNSGTPYELGVSHGREMKDHIQTILRRQIERYGERLNNMPELDQALADPGRYFGSTELAELQGIADGAELPLEMVVSHNLAMCEDYVPGCVQFAVTGESNGGELIHSANEDSSLTLTLGDCLKRVVQFRAPEQGHRHVCFSIAGQLAGLNGFNEAGLAITSTLILDRTPRDVTRRGNIHPVIVSQVLSTCSTVDEAVELMRNAQRNGAWSVCVSDHKTDSLVYVEYDADEISVRRPEESLVGSNHAMMLEPTLETPDHSIHRLRRLEDLIWNRESKEITDELVEKVLRDQFDCGRNRVTAHPTMNTIRRVDNQISVVMRPAANEVRITPGPMNPEVSGEFVTINVADFFSEESVNVTPETPPVQVFDSTKPAPPSAAAFDTSKGLDGLPAVAERKMRRVILRSEDKPAASVESWMPQGTVAVYGQGPVAEQIVHDLASQSTSVVQLPLQTDAESVADAWNATAAGSRHLIIVTPIAPQTAGDFASSYTTTFAVAQQFVKGLTEANQIESGSLSFVTFMGGDFGLAGSPEGIAGGASSGLAKGLRREFPALEMHSIDFEANASAETVSHHLRSELANSSSTCEVAYVGNDRKEIAAYPIPVVTNLVNAPTPGTAWIVSGGARGVTAVVAKELGKRFGVKLHLLGSSPAPTIDPAWHNYDEAQLKELKKKTFADARERGEVPIEAWGRVERGMEVDRTLMTMRDEGLSITYHQCDVSSKASVEQIVESIRSMHGPVEGVIHGAGVEAACRFDRKKLPMVNKTYAVKVDGATHLANAVADHGVRFFIGFGSVSGRFGGLGQSDYSSSSDSLAKHVAHFDRKLPNCRVVTFHWPPWGEVGMAARPESRLALEAGGVSFMPPLEGAAFVLDEICSDSKETEIVVIDRPDGMDLDETLPPSSEWAEYLSATEPPRPTSSQSDAVAPSAASGNGSTGFANATAPCLMFPLKHFEATSDHWRADLAVDPVAEPLLANHRLNNRPLLPGAAMIELFAQAGRSILGENAVLRVRGFEIGKSLLFRTDAPRDISVIARQEAQGELTMQLVETNDPSAVLAVATVIGERSSVLANHAPRPKPSGTLFPTPYSDTTMIYHGDVLRTVIQLACRRNEAVGDIASTDVSTVIHSAVPEVMVTHPALVDGCFFACGIDAWFNNEDRVELPKACEDLLICGPIPPAGTTCHVTFRNIGSDESGSTYDIELYGSDNNPIYVMKGFRTINKGQGNE